MTLDELKEIEDGDDSRITSTQITDEGTFLAYDNSKVFFDSREGSRRELQGFNREGDQVIAARDIENYALGNSQGDILIFDSGKKTADIKSDYSGGVSSIRYINDSKLVAAIGRNLRFYEKTGETYEQTRQIDLKFRTRSIYSANENNNLFIVVDDERDSASYGNRLVLVNTDTYEMNSTNEPLFGISRVLKINGKLVIGTANGQLKLVDSETLAQLPSSEDFNNAHTKNNRFPMNQAISALSASDDNKLVASASVNGEIRVWNMDTNSSDFSKLEASARLGETPVSIINFGNSVYAIGRSGSVYKWAPAESGEEIVRIDESDKGVVSIKREQGKLYLVDSTGKLRTIGLS